MAHGTTLYCSNFLFGLNGTFSQGEKEKTVGGLKVLGGR